MSEAALLAIGELADATGVTVSTIRYYDGLGLVTPTGRVGGKRRFAAGAIGRVSFIRRAQQVGLTLDDIKAILDDRARRWPEFVRAHRVELERRRAEVDTMISMLEEVERCGCDVVAECPRMTAG